MPPIAASPQLWPPSRSAPKQHDRRPDPGNRRSGRCRGRSPISAQLAFSQAGENPWRRDGETKCAWPSLLPPSQKAKASEPPCAPSTAA